MSELIFLDTETTGLNPKTEQVFEIAIVESDGTEHVWTLQPHPLTVRNMHPEALRVNKYHERTDSDDWRWTVSMSDPYGKWEITLREIAEHLDGKHIVGAVPDFDLRFLRNIYTEFLMDTPKWHHHIIDIEAVAVGYIKSEIQRKRKEGESTKKLEKLISLPYRSDDLAAWFGVGIDEEHRHTALGDALWTKRWWEAMT